MLKNFISRTADKLEEMVDTLVFMSEGVLVLCDSEDEPRPQPEYCVPVTCRKGVVL